jgi:hypothetical protein
MKLTTLAIAAACVVTGAFVGNADAGRVYTYACHRPDDFKLYTAKVDTTKKTITWDGVTYRNLKQVTVEADGSECPKVCFRAKARSGDLSLNTATQGVATLSVTYGKPGSDGVDEAECDLLRP